MGRSPRRRAWIEADRRLEVAGVSPKQVQVAWVKLANVRPTGELTEHGKKLQSDTLGGPAEREGSLSQPAHRLPGQPHLRRVDNTCR